MPGHSLDPLAHDRQRVLGQVDQDRPRLRHGVLAQARRAGGHGEGHVQPQPGLGALGGTADHAHRAARPRALPPASAGSLSALEISPTRTTGSDLLSSHGHRHTFAFFLSAGRGVPRLIDLQVTLLVKLRDLVRHAVGQELAAHDHEQAVVARAVIDQRVHELGRHERRVAGLRQRVLEQLQELLARGGLGHQPRADPGPQRHEVFLPQQFQEPAVSREDHRQQRRGVEVGTGENPQLTEDVGAHLLRFVDQEHRADP